MKIQRHLSKNIQGQYTAIDKSQKRLADYLIMLPHDNRIKIAKELYIMDIVSNEEVGKKIF